MKSYIIRCNGRKYSVKAQYYGEALFKLGEYMSDEGKTDRAYDYEISEV